MRHRLLNDYVAAAREHEWALATARSAQAEEIEAEALVGLSLTRSAADRDAIAPAALALEIATARGLALLRGDALDALARAYHQQGHIQIARRHARQALQVYVDSGHRWGESEARLTLAMTRPAPKQVVGRT